AARELEAFEEAPGRVAEVALQLVHREEAAGRLGLFAVREARAEADLELAPRAARGRESAVRLAMLGIPAPRDARRAYPIFDTLEIEIRKAKRFAQERRLEQREDLVRAGSRGRRLQECCQSAEDRGTAGRR